jgi:calcineurin-like phosphoesterase family protein
MRNLFSSDPHFGHKNIITYCNRPFKTLEEMDATIIKNWNSKVKKDDVVFMIGDFCFKNTKNMTHRGEGNIYPASYYEQQLNGKIIFIGGSHDRNNTCKTCIQNIKIRLGGQMMNLVHDPKFADYNVEINLCGHVHNHWRYKKFQKDGKTTYMINVGMDVNGFYPVTIEEILSGFSKWQKTQK